MWGTRCIGNEQRSKGRRSGMHSETHRPDSGDTGQACGLLSGVAVGAGDKNVDLANDPAGSGATVEGSLEALVVMFMITRMVT